LRSLCVHIMTYRLVCGKDKSDWQTLKVLVAADVAGIELDVDNKEHDLKEKSPFGITPVLDTPDGSLWGSDAILRFLGRVRTDSGLYGHSFLGGGQVDQWLDFIQTDFDGARGLWLSFLTEDSKFEEEAYKSVRSDCLSMLGVINQHLLYNTYMVGHNLTLVDIALACSIIQLHQKVLTSDVMDEANLSNVARWFSTVINHPNFAKVTSQQVGPLSQAKEEQKPHKAKGGAKGVSKKLEGEMKSPKTEAKKGDMKSPDSKKKQLENKDDDGKMKKKEKGEKGEKKEKGEKGKKEKKEKGDKEKEPKKKPKKKDDDEGDDDEQEEEKEKKKRKKSPRYATAFINWYEYGRNQKTFLF